MRINGQTVKALRERSGITVTALAAECGTKQAHLSNIEAGRRNASDELILRLAESLKVSVLAIIRDEAEAVAS